MPQLHLTLGKTQYPLYRRLVGPQGWSGQVRKITPHGDSIPRPSSPQAVAIPTTLPTSQCFVIGDLNYPGAQCFSFHQRVIQHLPVYMTILQEKVQCCLQYDTTKPHMIQNKICECTDRLKTALQSGMTSLQMIFDSARSVAQGSNGVQ